MKEGQEEEPLENVYQSLEFDKNNEDIESRQREIHFRSNKSTNSISQSTSTDWMKQQEEASRTNRMMSTIDSISKKPPSQEGGFE